MPEKNDSRADQQIRIIVVQTAFLGDIILTTPLLNALKTIYPRSYLALLTTPVGKQALSGLEELDEIISYDKKHSESGPAAFINKVREVRSKKFELAISPHRSLRSALLLGMSGIPVLVGFEDAALSWIYHLRVKRNKAEHDVKRNLSLLGPVAKLPEHFQPRIKLPLPPDFDPAKFGVNLKERPLIGFAPGSAWPTKRWPAPKFAGLAKSLAEELGAKIILLGDQGDVVLCQEIEDQAATPVLNLAGKTGLQELFAIISKLDVLVSNDSAPVHAASAFATPAAVIYGPTTPQFGYGPWLNPHRIIQKEMSCRPCHHHGPRQCPEKHFNCMSEIGISEVADEVKELLKEQARKEKN